MRARLPDAEGYVDSAGAKIGYEVFGDRQPTILLLPTWTIIHSRFWKAQIPYLARHYRVVTFDGPGNGRSERPLDPDAYSAEAATANALAVLDATDTEQAVVVGLSKGAFAALSLSADHADRVLGSVFIGPALPMTPPLPERAAIRASFLKPYDQPQDWEKYNAAYWRDHYEDFLEFFFSRCFAEPHSTKQREDCVGWACETTPEVLIADAGTVSFGAEEARRMAHRVDCPVLVIHGEDDQIRPLTSGRALAEATGGRLVVLEGAGHIPLARDPVEVNRLIKGFVEEITGWSPAPVRWTRARNRRRRVLYISSPIGLGHARRDVAIAEQLRRHHPDVQIDWLAQHPVTRVLEAAGETVHPASRWLVSESGHIESESGEHDLHCFQAWRRMDEVLVANFMTFHDVVADGGYDLVIGDEAWDVDYFLHENPELKRFAYAWFTDFVGWLPMPDGGEHEAELTADYNAEMIEQIARYPRLRDQALFVGAPDDIVPDDFGPDLPGIREWTEAHYEFPGYITGFDPDALADQAALRHRLGYRADERVCVVTVGGSGVGDDLLRRVIAAYPYAQELVPGLRMVVVAGPRIDPQSLPSREGLEIYPYVHDLHLHLAACDVAVVQGGLTTCMELVANRRPFLYFPLKHHFEQNFHVAHRLRRYDAGRRMDYDQAPPKVIAQAIATEIGRRVEYRPVSHDGAARAATLVAELL